MTRLWIERTRPWFPGSGQAGAALIAVLGILAVLSIMASTVATNSLAHRRAAASYAASVQAAATADSALRLVLLRLHAPASANRSAPLDTEFELEVFGAVTTVRLTRESGRINLNLSSEDLLFAAFASHGMAEPDARGLAARVLDWRNAAQNSRASVESRREYHLAGLPYEPRGGPFEMVEEIRQVLGGEAISTAMMDLFTVFGQHDVPHEPAASTAVRGVLQWADQHHLGGRRWLSQALRSDVEVPSGEPLDSTVGSYRTSLHGELVRATACTASVMRGRCRTAVVRLTGNLESPFHVHEWRTSD